MEKGKRHIFYAFALLICFAAGQWAIYAHQHKTFVRMANTARGAALTEKCQLCDAMHHNNMVQEAPVAFVAPINAINHVYKQSSYDFISISLILSAGRAPPSA